MPNKQARFEELLKLIQDMDAGVIQITVYKGMPVKVRLVTDEVVLGGEKIVDLNDVSIFSPRIWWKKPKSLDK